MSSKQANLEMKTQRKSNFPSERIRKRPLHPSISIPITRAITLKHQNCIHKKSMQAYFLKEYRKYTTWLLRPSNSKPIGIAIALKHQNYRHKNKIQPYFLEESKWPLRSSISKPIRTATTSKHQNYRHKKLNSMQAYFSKNFEGTWNVSHFLPSVNRLE